MSMISNFISKIKLKKTPQRTSLFSESCLKTSFYEELQKNEWCNVVTDKPDNLFEIISIRINKTKKVN